MHLDPLRLMRDIMRRTSFYPAYKDLGHYPDYWYWIARGKPARTPHLLKQHLVRQYACRYQLAVLIEAGTYYGEMVNAMKSRFEDIYSIELDPGLAQSAAKRFSRHKHIHIFHGNSQQLIPELLSKLTRPALFWLDAGYYGFGNRQGNKDRLITELNSILQHPITEHVILMDDVHGLNGENGAPTLEAVIQQLNSQYPDRIIKVEHNILAVTPG